MSEVQCEKCHQRGATDTKIQEVAIFQIGQRPFPMRDMLTDVKWRQLMLKTVCCRHPCCSSGKFREVLVTERNL